MRSSSSPAVRRLAQRVRHHLSSPTFSCPSHVQVNPSGREPSFPFLVWFVFFLASCLSHNPPTPQCTTTTGRATRTGQDPATETVIETTTGTTTETTTEDEVATAAAPGRRAASGTTAIMTTIARGMVKPHCLEDENLMHCLVNGLSCSFKANPASNTKTIRALCPTMMTTPTTAAATVVATVTVTVTAAQRHGRPLAVEMRRLPLSHPLPSLCKACPATRLRTT